jgi:predicted GNAT family acetyltransferase
MTSSHPLDRPVWNALAGRQARFDQTGVLARRFPAEISPLCAARDASVAAVAALAALVTAGDDISLLETAPPSAPPGIATVTRPCVQMTASRLSPGGREAPTVALGEADAPAMLALATLTKPGPFRARTHTLGRFLGIKIEGRLVAMCGERLSPDGFLEVSALCTHPDFRGRGFGEALLRAVASRILREGETPFLHSYADNEAAVALYRRIGFSVRAEIVHAVWNRHPQ